MTEVEKLRALLREAGAWMLADAKMNKDYAKKVLELHGRITAALAERPECGAARPLDGDASPPCRLSLGHEPPCNPSPENKP